MKRPDRFFVMRDFDDLVKLYQEDPDKFDRECREAIEDFISQLPEDCQTKVRQQQWNINNELRKYKDPVARFNKMVELFWEGFSKFNQMLNTRIENNQPSKKSKDNVVQLRKMEDNILPFKKH